MDALNFDSGEYDDPFVERKQLKRQLEAAALQREFSKAYNGFLAHKQNGVQIPVETGHWGCGAYAGNADLKAALQILAASAAGVRRLVYYSFGVRECHSQLAVCLLIRAQDADFADRVRGILTDARAEQSQLVRRIQSACDQVNRLRSRDEMEPIFGQGR